MTAFANFDKKITGDAIFSQVGEVSTFEICKNYDIKIIKFVRSDVGTPIDETIIFSVENYISDMILYRDNIFKVSAILCSANNGDKISKTIIISANFDSYNHVLC